MRLAEINMFGVYVAVPPMMVATWLATIVLREPTVPGCQDTSGLACCSVLVCTSFPRSILITARRIASPLLSKRVVRQQQCRWRCTVPPTWRDGRHNRAGKAVCFLPSVLPSPTARLAPDSAGDGRMLVYRRCGSRRISSSAVMTPRYRIVEFSVTYAPGRRVGISARRMNHVANHTPPAEQQCSSAAVAIRQTSSNRLGIAHLPG